MGTTCTIRLLWNVSEEIAARNQQLPVNDENKYFSQALQDSFFVLVSSCKPEILAYPLRLEQSQTVRPQTYRKQAHRCCFVLSRCPGQYNKGNILDVDQHIKA